MYSIFSKAKTISDFIPPQYQDIHSHLLFGIDDGAKTIEDSDIILQTFVNLGVDKVITTPHISEHIWNNTPQIIENKFIETKTKLPEITSKLDLKFASEYLIDDAFLDKVINKELLTYNNNFVLVEFSYYNLPLNYLQIFFEMQLNGYNPILAHPERYLYFHNNLEIFKEIKKTGVKFQLNLLSLLGYYGIEVQKVADELLKRNIYDFTGSDLHHKMHCNAILNHQIKIKHTNSLTDIMQNNNEL